MTQTTGSHSLIELASIDASVISLILDQASAFMHELGHTLGLRHGGQDDIPFKPNYHSIMNYSWQYQAPPHRPEWRAGWHLDFTGNQALPLNEAALVDNDGIWDATVPNQVRFKIPFGPATCVDGKTALFWAPNLGRVDWNQNRKWDTCVGCDINRWAGIPTVTYPCANATGCEQAPPSPNEVLISYSDWDKIQFLP